MTTDLIDQVTNDIKKFRRNKNQQNTSTKSKRIYLIKDFSGEDMDYSVGKVKNK